MAAIVYREEGIAGFFRGIWIPLVTISAVRACYARLCSGSDLIALSDVLPPARLGAASFSMYTGVKDRLHENGLLNQPRMIDIALAAGLGGAASGAVISVGSTREYRFVWTTK